MVDVEDRGRLVDGMADGVVAIGADGRYTEVNDAFLDLVGYDRGAVLGAGPSFVHDEAGARSVETAIAALRDASGERSRRFETAVETADGDRVSVEVRLSRLGTNDEFEGAVGVLRDVSGRDRRERDLERYERLVEASGDAVYALDTRGRFTFSNEAHQAVVGRDDFELIGEHASIALPERAVAEGEKLIGELLDSDRRNGTFEMDVLRPDGERVPTENHVALLTDEDGEFRGTVGVLRNISDRQRRERELERQNERLERFASIVSHDLRNPLTVARGYLELVDAEDEAIRKVDQSLDRIETIVEDVLELSQQGRTIDEPVPVELGDVARVAWTNVETNGASFTVDSDATVLADEGRLVAILENLFRNAVEHGSTSPRSHTREDAVGDTPSDESSVADAPEDAVEHGSTSDQWSHGEATAEPVDDSLTVHVGTTADGFYVADDGTGIPTDERERIFDVGFTTGDTGTGQGLAIVDEIASAHGWDLSVGDSADGGARFTFGNVAAADADDRLAE